MEQKFALIIGIEQYQDTKISPVGFAEADAVGIAEALELHGFLKGNKEVLLSSCATKTIIESRLRKFLSIAGPKDNLIIFYAGHGFAENDHNYITCHDSQMGDLVNTSISLQYIMKEMGNSKCQHTILFLDSCHSGLKFEESMRGILSEMSEVEFSNFFKDSEYQIGFASCKNDQFSYSSKLLSHGIWSYHIIDALRGNKIDALERGKFLTADSLQSYLSEEVPRTLRKTITGTVIQTPCMFGNLTKGFIIADLTRILEEKETNAKPTLLQLKRVLFSGQTVGNIKSLTGFLKTHRVPDQVNHTTERFVARIGYNDLKKVVEDLYQSIKENFKYKRQDVELNIQEGEAGINCKDFDVDIFLSIKPDDPSEYLLEIQVGNFHSQGVVLEKAFNDVFANKLDSLNFAFGQPINVKKIIDNIEKINSEEISVKFPANCDSCAITINGLEAEIKIEQNYFSIIMYNKTKPVELVKNFFKAQSLLVNTHHLKELTFDTEN